MVQFDKYVTCNLAVENNIYYIFLNAQSHAQKLTQNIQKKLLQQHIQIPAYFILFLCYRFKGMDSPNVKKIINKYFLFENGRLCEKTVDSLYSKALLEEKRRINIQLVELFILINVHMIHLFFLLPKSFFYSFCILLLNIRDKKIILSSMH